MKKLGFGCMRLPMTGGADSHVDLPQFCEMVDSYLAAGFRYFDTAHVYINGESETALREALVKRHPRGSFVLTDKLSGSCYDSREEIRPLFERQLAACGVEYFDYYLLHALSAEVYKKVERCRAFEEVCALRDEGKIRHIGISFHDRPEVLERILREHPEIEVVQIQLNYIDYDSPVIQSGAVYDICRRYDKPVLVMEPVKGGALADLPAPAQQLLDKAGIESPAALAIRYAASFGGVMMVLSGMSSTQQMRDNISHMRDFHPLDEWERQLLGQVRDILKAESTVPCTGCRYCVPGCPMDIQIPDLFAAFNAVQRYHDWPSNYYLGLGVQGHGHVSDCVGCRQCENICPQHLPVTQWLQQVGQALEQSQMN